ncbi:magnesium transporter [Hahella sp. SMD15-11]|uniref:Magnesium transporter MgtE n=1 Tax=Thermohahella caldifontis TaxID=3142973 RepID=A0AB39US03_9GAMM
MSDELQELIEDVVEAEEAHADRKDIQHLLGDQEPEELALLLESLPVEQRVDVWRKLPADKQLDVLVAMRADPRERILDDLSREETDTLLTDLDAEDLLELAESLSPRMVERALTRMDTQQQEWFHSAQKYPEDQAGHWVDHELILLPQNARVRDALRALRREQPEYCDTIFLINRAGQFADLVKIANLWQQPDHVPLADLTEDDCDEILATEDAVDAAMKVQKSGLAALPVVDEQRKLLGRMDIGTACELVNEYYEGQLMAAAGMDEDEDLFAPVTKSAQGRAVWLGINLLTAFAASWFIGLFEDTLQQVVALAVLMPIVASMGGIAGSQTLTLMIRGLALNQITDANFMALLKKELAVGGLNGLIWAAVIGLIAWVWFGSPMIGVVIALAILINILAAALSGVVIPMILDRLKIDPALSGSVILTTVTDIVGFVAFLGLGTLFLL